MLGNPPLPSPFTRVQPIGVALPGMQRVEVALPSKQLLGVAWRGVQERQYDRVKTWGRGPHDSGSEGFRLRIMRVWRRRGVWSLWLRG